MKNVIGPGSADYHYYNWVDQFDTLGLGPNVPIAPGSGSNLNWHIEGGKGRQSAIVHFQLRPRLMTPWVAYDGGDVSSCKLYQTARIAVPAWSNAMRNVGRGLIFVVLGLVGGGIAAAQDKTFEEVVPLEPGSLLTLETGRGTVRLTSWDEPTVDIHARIEPPPSADADDARRAVDATTVEVRGSRRSMRIRSNYRRVSSPGSSDESWRRPLVHYEIRAPTQLDLDLSIDQNETTLEGFEGRLLLDFDRSSLAGRDLDGTITLVFDRGAINVSGLSGSIALDLDRTTAILRDVRIDADSIVEIDRGELDLLLVGTQSLTIDADVTRRATVSSDLPVPLEPSGQGLQATMNGGGVVLRIEADRSTLRLRTN